MYFDERDYLVDLDNKSSSSEVNYSDVDYNNTYVDTINIINYNRGNNKLYTSSEGFNKGNMFKELYDPYKKYSFKVVVNGKKDELLLRIQQLTFNLIDLGLYLDLNPMDRDIYYDYKATAIELNRNKDLYESNYGPLCMSETINYDNYRWLSDPWPWMREGGK